MAAKRKRKLPSRYQRFDDHLSKVTLYLEELADKVADLPDKKLLLDSFPQISETKPLYEALKRIHE